MLRINCALIAAFMSSFCFSQEVRDVESNIWYTIINKEHKTVELSSRNSVIHNDYGTGVSVYPTNFNIPEHITDEYGIEYTVNSVGESAFEEEKSILLVSMPNSIKSIGERAFKKCYNLTNVSLSNSINSINSNAFAECESLESISIPNNVTTIEDCAFKGSGISSVTFPKNINTISSESFMDCFNLDKINIPEGVTSIDFCAFMNCNNLKSIELPSSLTYIGFDAFAHLSKLNKVVCHAKRMPKVPEEDAFHASNTKNAILYVPKESLELYKTTLPWSEFGTIIAIPSESGMSRVGDVNGDGRVNVADIQAICNIIEADSQIQK